MMRGALSDRAVFEKKYRTAMPVVVKGLASQWGALENWRPERLMAGEAGGIEVQVNAVPPLGPPDGFRPPGIHTRPQPSPPKHVRVMQCQFITVPARCSRSWPSTACTSSRTKTWCGNRHGRDATCRSFHRDIQWHSRARSPHSVAVG